MLQSFWMSRPSCSCFGSLCTSHSPTFKIGNRSILHLFPALRVGGLEVALCELTYYHCWRKIGAELGDNKVSDGHTVLDIPDGYYNVCELDEEAFRPLGAKLLLHAPTGRLQLSAKKRLVLNSGLAKLVWFSWDIWARPEPHCRGTSLSGHPSGDLRASCRGQYVGEPPQRLPLHNAEIRPVENERCGGGWTETFTVLQYKRLASGPVSELTLMALDMSGRRLYFDHMSATLHTRNNGWRGWPWERQKMHRAGFSQSGGYRRIRKGWGGRVSCMLSSCLVGCTNESRSPPKRELGHRRSSESWATLMFHLPPPGGYTHWHLLEASGLPLRTPSNKRGGSSTWRSRLLTWWQASSTRFGRW